MCKSTENKENLSRKITLEKRGARNPNRQAQESRGGRSKSTSRFNQKQIRHVQLGKDEGISEGDDNTSSSADEDIERIVKHLKVCRMSKGRAEKNECAILINGAEVVVAPDTGADANVMDEHQFRSLQQQAAVETELRETKTKLKTLTEELPVLGECQVTMENETRKTAATIAIIEGKIDSYPLLGRKTLEELGMVKFDASGRLKESNRHPKLIKQVSYENREVIEIISRYETRFEGVGQVKRDGEIVKINLPVKEKVQPVAQKPRRVPYHLMEPLQKRINEFVECGIMEKVPECEAIGWCSPLVVQPKPKDPSDCCKFY